jgi:hypothetical protein
MSSTCVVSTRSFDYWYHYSFDLAELHLSHLRVRRFLLVEYHLMTVADHATGHGVSRLLVLSKDISTAFRFSTLATLKQGYTYFLRVQYLSF